MGAQLAPLADLAARLVPLELRVHTAGEAVEASAVAADRAEAVVLMAAVYPVRRAAILVAETPALEQAAEAVAPSQSHYVI